MRRRRQPPTRRAQLESEQPVSRRGAPSARSQATLGAIDQAVSSTTNFAMVVAAAVALTPAGFGVFAAAYTLYTILISGLQALVSQELVLTTGHRAIRLARCRESLILAVGIGIVVGLLVAVAGVLISPMTDSLLVLAVAIPLLFLQDTIRFAAPTVGKMGHALASDTIWLSVSVGLILAARALAVPTTPAHYVAYWAIGGVIAGLAILPSFGPFDQLPPLRRFARREYLGYRFIVEFIAIRGTAQSLVLLLGWMAGLAATGSVRAASTLFGPVGVVIIAAASFGAPVLRRVSPHRREPVLLAAALGLTAATIVFAVAVMTLPTEWGEAILGQTWDGARDLAPAFAAQTALLALSTAIFLALRLVEPESTLRVRLIAAAGIIPAFFLGYAVGEVEGAVWGLCLSNVLQVVLGLTAYVSLRAKGIDLGSLDRDDVDGG